MASMNGEASLDGKVCLVTGATHGIGFTTARALARMGATVWIHGRHAARGQRVLDEIRRDGGDRDVRFVQADFARLDEVRRLAAMVESEAPRLDVLVDNAGLVSSRPTTTVDGFETTFAVNHLAPFLLTRLLLGKLERSAPARIVVVASEAHRRARLEPGDLSRLGERCFDYSSGGYSAFRAYARSKLANILFTRALAMRLAGRGVTVNALHPGVVHTNLFRSASPLVGLGVAIVGRFFMVSPEEGAKTSIYLASSPEVEGRSGGYYSRCRLLEPTAAASSDEDAERLWELSSRLAGLSPS